MRQLYTLFALAFYTLICGASPTHAHSENGVDFSTLKDKLGMSCCSDRDCHIYPDSIIDMSHFRDGYIRVKLTYGSVTLHPMVYLSEIIKPPPGVPDGHVVVCHAGLEVFCVALEIPATS